MARPNHLEVVEICSYIRGYHVYMDIWDSVVGQELLLKWEPDNSEDSHAVAVLDEEVVSVYSLQFSTQKESRSRLWFGNP